MSAFWFGPDISDQLIKSPRPVSSSCTWSACRGLVWARRRSSRQPHRRSSRLGHSCCTRCCYPCRYRGSRRWCTAGRDLSDAARDPQATDNRAPTSAPHRPGDGRRHWSGKIDFTGAWNVSLWSASFQASRKRIDRPFVFLERGLSSPRDISAWCQRHIQRGGGPVSGRYLPTDWATSTRRDSNRWWLPAIHYFLTPRELRD